MFSFYEVRVYFQIGYIGMVYLERVEQVNLYPIVDLIANVRIFFEFGSAYPFFAVGNVKFERARMTQREWTVLDTNHEWRIPIEKTPKVSKHLILSDVGGPL